MKITRNIQKSLGLALIALVVSGVPAQAKWSWRVFGGVLATAAGVISGSTGNVPLGVGLISLQGTLLSSAAKAAKDSRLGNVTDTAPGYAAGPNGPQFCADGGLSCPAAQALMRIDIQPIEVNPEWTAGEIAFANAVNRVIEDGNLFALHSREDASLEVKKHDLRLMADSIAAAADIYDRLNQPLNLTQEDIAAFQGGVATTGLPPAEQSFWENTNLTSSEIEAVAKFLGETNLELGVSSVSVSRILREEAAALAPAAD